jgi:hypothetical protein
MADSASDEHGGQCRSCPACAALRVVREAHPDVAVHLAAAGDHLLRAARAFLATVDTGSTTPDDVWAEDRCGTTSDVPTADDSAHPTTSVTSLRRIAVD